MGIIKNMVTSSTLAGLNLELEKIAADGLVPQGEIFKSNGKYCIKVREAIKDIAVTPNPADER